jgi:hypothetical protein
VSRYALATHCRFWTEKCRSVRITGNATFTMDPSRRSMNATAHVKARVSLPRRVSRKDGGDDAVDIASIRRGLQIANSQ